MAIGPIGSSTLRILPQLNQRQSTLFGQLASGNRLTSAAVDAAGLSVAQELTAQVNGLGQAENNANDALNMLETGGSALTTTQNILQQENTLAIQAANDTLTAGDRQIIQQQITQLNQGITDIANQTQFNTQPLLSGQAGGLTISGGNQVAQNVTGQIGVTNGTANITVTALGTAGQVTGPTAINGSTFAGGGSVTVTGPNGSTTLTTTAGETVGDFVQQLNNSNIGVTATVNGSGQLQIATNGVGTNQTVTVSNANGADITATLGLANGAGTGTNATATVNGVAQTAQGNTFTVTGAAGATGLQFTAGATGNATVNVTQNPGVTFQVGANQGQTLTTAVAAANTGQLGVANLDLTTQAGAENAIGAIQAAISTTSTEQAHIGATENRLTNVATNASLAQENALAARSRIADTDLAKASSELNSVLLQQKFSLFSLQQQANVFALQSSLLAGR